jgi:HPt (histidine-containing phosphotransfer) domain-containing protein
LAGEPAQTPLKPDPAALVVKSERDRERPVFDLAQLETLATFLPAQELRELVRLYLEHSADCVSRITVLAASSDFAALGRAAHELVGSAGNVGALDTHRLAKALEMACKAGDDAACRQVAAELPQATELVAGWLRAWLADSRPDAATLPALATAIG